DFIQIKLIIVGKEKEITIVDVLREAETVHKPVKRIVVLATESAEVLRALNAEDKVVGVATSIRERPGNKAFLPELSKLPGVGSSWRLDYEAVLNLDPDVLLPFGVWSTGGAESKREYKEKLTGVTIISLDLTRPDDFAENVRKLGYILDKEEEAEMLINWLDKYDNKIKSRTEGLSDDEKPQVFLWCFYTLGGGYRTACKGNNIDRICNIAGGRNIAADLPGGWWPTVDPEWVVEQNPDIIVTHGGGAAGYHTDDPSEMKAMREEVMNRPELANVNAVKNRKVYRISTSQGGLTSGAGSLIAIAYYGKWLHPDLFVNLDPQAIHQEYLDKFHKDLNFNVYEHGVFVYPEPS
ncbi:MAG: ABC transporter substrate-binding protein, partial [Methanophagales archaeon]|nr:ABC transporter substrate-binding protein [Methanophagales archaeon]